MKLSKNFSWYAFQMAVANKQNSLETDGYMYDIIYTSDGAMITNKRPVIACVEDIIQNVPDCTPITEGK